jgi:ABC-type branched-subunit amino acid transport system ATPase component
MRDDDLTLIGEHYGLGRAASSVFGIAREDRRQGLHLIGQPGTGKSSLMLAMLRQDIARGEGVTLIDPHGHLAERLLGHVPPERLKDVWFTNLAEGRRVVEAWRVDYNLHRPHTSLRMATPAAFAQAHPFVRRQWSPTPEPCEGSPPEPVAALAAPVLSAARGFP